MPSEKAKRLLNLLHEDGARPLNDLATLLGASRQNVTRYLKQLEQDLLITYTIIENPNVHEVRTFFIEIKTNPEEPEIVTRLNEIAGVQSIDGIIGQNSLVAKFCTRNDEQFTEVLKQVDGIITGTRFQHYKIINCIKTFKIGGMDVASSAGVERTGVQPVVDPVDEAILDALQAIQDADGNPVRFSFEWLAAQLGTVSYSQARRRVKAMVDAGVISSFTIKIMPALIPRTDFNVKFYLQLLPKQLSEYNTIAAGILASENQIVELYRTGEEYGLFATVRTASIAEYRLFIEGLYRTGKIQDSISTLVIDEKLPAVFKPFRISFTGENEGKKEG